MKTHLILFVFAIFCFGANISAQNQYYPNNIEPLLKTQYMKLPLGAVKPTGWLRDQLVVQANGLTGHLHEVWGIAHTSSWKGDFGQNVLPECCYPRFVPRWLEGLVPLAYQLDDDRLKKIANRYMGYVMTLEDPAIATPSLVGWSHMGRILQGYYEATGDDRAIKTCQRIFDYCYKVKDVKDGGVVTKKRLGMFLGFSWWGYNKTGDLNILKTVEAASKNNVDEWADYFTNFEERDSTGMPGYPQRIGSHGLHGVDVTQAIQYPVSYYLYSKDESYKNSIFKGMEFLDKHNGQVNGRWNADEWLAGDKPTQGTELCNVTEMTYSLVKDFEALGVVSLADRLERLVYNALPGTCTGDMWAHQYDQQANQVLVSDDSTRIWHENTSTSNVYGFTPHYPCCLSNMHSTYPRFVENMWMATNDNGLIAVAYGPNVVTAKVGKNIDVTITQETNYPFSDEISFNIKVSESGSFPLYFRIPEWAEGSVVTIGKETQHPLKGSICKIERKWTSGQVLKIKFNHKLSTEDRYNNAVSVSWGPLDFALRIGESFKKINIHRDRYIQTSYPTGVADWQIEATTPWNYGLVINNGMSDYQLEYKTISKMPFAQRGEPVFLPGAMDFVPWDQDVPLVLKVKARRISNWKMDGANAGDVPLIPIASDKEEIVELIPYGCTRLRISEFPVIKK